MKYLTIVVVLMTIMAAGAAAENPPSLTAFHQFYGKIIGLPDGNFQLKAIVSKNSYVVSDKEYTTPIASDGKYGYPPYTFKVLGDDGDSIDFYLVDQLGSEISIGATTFVSGTIEQKYFTYPGYVPPPLPECNDGDDNDGDGLIDLDDSGCISTNDNDEINLPPTTSYQCSDGIDNDGDIKIDYPSDIGCSSSSDNDETNPAASSTSSGTKSNSGSSSGSTSQITTPGTCTQSWECGNWGLCRDNQQSRICYRVDNCDQVLSQNPATAVQSVPKPSEQQPCQSAILVSSTICSSGFKRCLGTQLQQCSADGKQWNTLQTCSYGCDSVLLECKEASVLKSPTQQPTTTPKWMYYLLGSVVLLAVIILVIFNLVHQKKFTPAKNYIAQCRSRGFSDTQIKTRLVQEGWDAGKISKLMQR